MAARVSRLRPSSLCRSAQVLGMPRSLFSTQQPVQYTGKGLSEEVFADVERRDATLREKYDLLPTAFPAESQPPGGSIDRVEAFRKRLLYRSKQRGWLEVDLLLGTWAARNVPRLSEAELAQYEALLNRETLDLYNWVTGKEAPPPELQGPLIDGIVAFVRAQPLGRASQEGYLGVKRNMSN